MSDYQPIVHSPLEPSENSDEVMNDWLPPPSVILDFDQRQVKLAIAASLKSLPPLKMDEATRKAGLREVKRLHDADLYKTQDNYHTGSSNRGSVLLLVNFPESRSSTSCRFTSFNTGRIRLTYEQVLATGSELLADLLVNERHQRRARKAAGLLLEGVDYVLDLSPTIDENDYTIALQLLSVPHAVQLWYRSMALGASPLAVAGHDDVCTCLTPFDEPYPFPTPPESIKSQDGNVCILDTKEWRVEDNHKIDDFCTTRWAANTLRLFRAISMPPGQKDLVIDSAPRMWTLVGLFAKLEMTNRDILRDDVVAWFNADMNHAFVELCPEETLHIGLILKTPILTEPAFRILVNERALEVAGGQPRSQPKTTLLGRRCSEFTGTDVAESISRMIEHASCAMSARYKIALDGLCGDNGLDLLDIPEWRELRGLDHMIPNESRDIETHYIRVLYDRMMESIQQVFRDTVERVIQCRGEDLPFEFAASVRCQRFHRRGVTIEQIEERRAFSVPRGELLTTQSFEKVYNSLDRYQRALTSVLWVDLSAMASDLSNLVGKDKAAQSVIDFRAKFDEARRDGGFLCPLMLDLKGVPSHGSCDLLFKGIMTKLKAYVSPLIARDEKAFIHTLTPHLLLSLDDHEMNFLRLADDEGTFQTEAPETDLGPSGPGPAYHTGQTVPSVSDLDFEKLAVESVDGGTSTVGGSMAAQDGISTVYDRTRVLARSAAPSIASEQFTDDSDAMSADYAEAEYVVPAVHQTRGQTLAHVVEQETDEEEEEEEEDDLQSLDLDLDGDSDSATVMGDDDVAEAVPDPHAQELEDEEAWSEDFDDSDFEVIKKDETI
ncbi:hypothetical protein N0V93_004203 [Gnomoniopsis smithogilvyi]|uniref:Uncharacterized protein n=1 Tax=Gnomoniopsis smithogilvyi TaxID=1191159 RepID=A0A9W8YQN6_9PEZI|nr:hypothetical protein N0V93_004203 [Gnomoniopsis smithogilvyi]